MYTVLSGAKINMGDFLITKRAMDLLSLHRPEHELKKLPHWEPLDTQLDQVNDSAAIVILGGPGFQPRFYPGVYKLCADLDRIRVPIIPMGLGWKGVPGTWETLASYEFDASSRRALERISKEAEHVGCRDYLTRQVLLRAGVENALMTGCPVWYHPESIGKPFARPEEITKFVVTPAQRHVYREQSIQLLERLARSFPGAARWCSFNRGIDQDSEWIPAADRRNNRAIARRAEELGYQVADTSGGLEGVDFYDECDLHVGYRVHSHLYFTSVRKPSFLIHEDGRGRGVSAALSQLGTDAFAPPRIGPLRKLRASDHTVEMVATAVEEELENGFARFAGSHQVIDAHYEIMKRFLAGLPA